MICISKLSSSDLDISYFSSCDSSELMSFLGTLLGVGTSVAFGVMFVKGSVRIDLRKFFKVTTVILWFVPPLLRKRHARR